MSQVQPAAGETLPPRRFTPTSRQTVQYAAMSGELSEIHYDPAGYERLGADRPLIHGGLKAAWVVQCALAWIPGREVAVAGLDLTYRGMDLVDDEYEIRGTVTAVTPTERGARVECAVEGGPVGTERLTTEGTVIVERLDPPG